MNGGLVGYTVYWDSGQGYVPVVVTRVDTYSGQITWRDSSGRTGVDYPHKYYTYNSKVERERIAGGVAVGVFAAAIAALAAGSRSNSSGNNSSNSNARNQCYSACSRSPTQRDDYICRNDCRSRYGG